uniref:Uncharacterized protein n=1 Tax=Myotis myotis TaxID=51298 RepID=A0A7J7QX19_MYOMY|nr:hypothetical protein mMyoMyo1_011279 [Myotis myotis]
MCVRMRVCACAYVCAPVVSPPRCTSWDVLPLPEKHREGFAARGGDGRLQAARWKYRSIYFLSLSSGHMAGLVGSCSLAISFLCLSVLFLDLRLDAKKGCSHNAYKNIAKRSLRACTLQKLTPSAPREVPTTREKVNKQGMLWTVPRMFIERASYKHDLLNSSF